MTKSRPEEIRDQCAALLAAMDASRTARPDDVWLFSSYKTFMRKYNDLVKYAQRTIHIDAPVDLYDLDKVPTNGNTVTIQQRGYFDEVYANLSIFKAYIEAHGGLINAEADNILNFLKSNLRKAILSEPSNEKDVQNAVEILLVGRGMQKGAAYDRETGRVKYAGKESIPDFIFPNERLALEIKLVNREGKLSSIIDEMNADIIAYSTKYERVWFLIYDVGFIRDEDEITSGLEQTSNVKCAIVKH